uniref:Reverse transcriptase domain-containing protein n=1 Tax=Acanthochromis polyacanthus TaxID=80966 RepID=A0A3Q1EEL5_9TELE
MEKDKKIELLERRLDDLEQYTRLNDVIVTGLEIRPRSYSRSPAFTVRRGCRQGCPVSPLLFALAIEPLAEAIRNDRLVAGIEVGPVNHKISLYCDDVLLFLSSPETSIARVVEIISDFSQFSGYKINYSKSEAMPLTPDLPWSPTCSAPFRWSPSGFVYLGIKITPSIYGLYKANFVPLIRKIKEDLARWTALPLSLLGRVNLFKMTILPRLLYPFQMIPALLTRKSLSVLNSSLSSFLWKNKRARLKLAVLQRPLEEGGLGVPDIKRYQVACLCIYLWHWFKEDPDSTWLLLEAHPVTPVPLCNLLHISKKWNSGWGTALSSDGH